MRKLNLPTATLIVSTLVVTLFSVAIKAEEESPTLFSQLDVDKNGLLSKNEVESIDSLAAMFDVLDIDKDGYLSLREFEGQMKD